MGWGWIRFAGDLGAAWVLTGGGRADNPLRAKILYNFAAGGRGLLVLVSLFGGGQHDNQSDGDDQGQAHGDAQAGQAHGGHLMPQRDTATGTAMDTATPQGMAMATDTAMDTATGTVWPPTIRVMRTTAMAWHPGADGALCG